MPKTIFYIDFIHIISTLSVICKDIDESGSHEPDRLLNSFEGKTKRITCNSQLIQCTFLKGRPVKPTTVNLTDQQLSKTNKHVSIYWPDIVGLASTKV
jgi:hypothetical protein